MYIAPGQGQTASRGQNFDVNRKALSLFPFGASFKEISLKSDFIHFFHDLYMHIAPGQGQGQPVPRGQSFNVNRNVLSFVASLKKSLWSLILYNFFNDLIHVYSPGAGADSLQGTKFWCQQKGLIPFPIWCKFQRNLFEVWFYTSFFHDLIHVNSPGAGGIQPQGTKFWSQQKLLVTSVICC